VNAARKIYFWENPKVLVILLKRFDYARHFKISNRINFPIKDLDLTQYTSCLNKNKIYNKYNLFAVSNHIGNMFGGHYYSYCKNNDGWYEFNDEKISKICSFEDNDIDKIVTQNAYLLFYEQI
jgi:ubiquitin carboxyl-terminal hydrolase 4/11/15